MTPTPTTTDTEPTTIDNPKPTPAGVKHDDGKRRYDLLPPRAMGALADIAGGYAALTVAPEGMEVTTVEYKINFLAAFQNGELQATGQVIKAGKRIIVTTAHVVHLAPDGKRSDCAVMQQTIVPVPKTY